jgi:TfoX/Sxy family transcriptional regulator of competence genes
VRGNGAEDGHVAPAAAPEPFEDLDCRRLPGPVRAEECEDLAARNGEVDSRDRLDATVCLPQTPDADDGVCAAAQLVVTAAPQVGQRNGRRAANRRRTAYKTNGNDGFGTSRVASTVPWVGHCPDSVCVSLATCRLYAEQHARVRSAAVAYDEKLAERIRELIGRERGVQEKKMFGGLAFLVGGNMAIAASGAGGILVRVDPKESAELVKKTKAREMVMRGRRMRGWLRVDAEDVRTKAQLAKWVERGTGYARSLPVKR